MEANRLNTGAERFYQTECPLRPPLPPAATNLCEPRGEFDPSAERGGNMASPFVPEQILLPLD